MTDNLTSGKPLKSLLLFTLPIIGGNIFQLFYTLADTLIVGQTIGENALAAVGSTSVFIYFILIFIQGMTNGFSIVLAQLAGEKDEEGMRKSIASSIAISLAFTIIVTAITLIFTPQIVRIMKTPDEISHDAAVYLAVIMAGTGATVLYNLASNILRALGDSRIPLITLVFSSILNVILDIVFIVPLKMGVGGAAFATVLSQLLSGILCFVFGAMKYSTMRLSKSCFVFDGAITSRNLRLGMIMGFQMSIMCIGQLVMQASVNNLGTVAIAGYTAATKADQLSILVNNAFIASIAAYVAQNYGARRIDRIKEGTKAALIITETSAIIMILIMIAVEPFLADIFVSDPSPEIREYIRTFFIITLPFYPVLALLSIFRTTVQSMGNSKAPFAACIAELFARCTASILLGTVFGYPGIIFSSPLAWICADSIVITAYARMMRNMRTDLTEPPLSS